MKTKVYKGITIEGYMHIGEGKYFGYCFQSNNETFVFKSIKECKKKIDIINNTDQKQTIREYLQDTLGVPDSDFIESPHSDLWVNVTPTTTSFILSHYEGMGNKYTIFTDQHTGKRVYDIAFGKDEPLDLYNPETI